MAIAGISNSIFVDYFRCPEQFINLTTSRDLSSEAAVLKFGPRIICDSRCAGDASSREVTDDSAEASSLRQVELPFDLAEVVNNLRYERYVPPSAITSSGITGSAAARRLYYFLRPMLSVPLRKYLQRVRLRGWEEIKFPHWPVDFTLDVLIDRVLGLVLKNSGIARLPFIWFWPDGMPSCAIMTHDVEHTVGRDFCGELMSLDERFSFKSAFQIVPEARYGTCNGFLDGFRGRGFEINVHDLNHDGFLFCERNEFTRRAKKINRYAVEFGAKGFRSGAMYRNQDWYDAFDFSYDMSVPNVAHLEPQRGGCCTVMPYFIGKILELPLTTVQDYSLFHILGDYTINLWKKQIELIMERNGLVSFITHPDYLIEKRARGVYIDLLSHVAQLRDQKKLWIALPGEVNLWWRNRQRMHLIQDGNEWRIEGPDSGRARIAYATLEGEDMVYSVGSQVYRVPVPA